MREDTDDFRDIFLRQIPLIDTRAPVEFARGAFPNAVNLPLMTDAERHQVGIRYKEQGQEAAIALGHVLVSGACREERIAAWREFAARHPDGFIYCFRGGLRSRTAQQWMREAGVQYPLVRGGYKAMRRFLLEELPVSLARAELVLVAGRTGTGKTRVIEALDATIDLERLAHHRGSTFGHMPDPQPSQIDFDNSLSIALLQLLAVDSFKIALEDEGRLIGRIALPEELRAQMQLAPLLVVEEPLENRVQVILEDYIHDLGARYREKLGDAGDAAHREQLLSGLGRIRKRLGGERHAEISAQMQRAFDVQSESGDDSMHRDWITTLLVQYYDPMYDYQMSRREGRVLAQGRRADIIRSAREFTRA